ncbi:Retinoid isomerohydrolase [Talaromyces pinophilus]|nr:Retinoid isomerohydrolase [Talaromyces pinophilus]
MMEKQPYNNYFVGEKDLKYVPPYFRDTPETTSEVDCVIKGVWPEWLNGTFVRIGAGRFTVPLSEDNSKPNAVLQHFFDGLGILHKFTMSNGQVRYSSRHTAEGIVRRAQKEGFVSTTMFGINANTPLKLAQDPCSALLGAQQSLFVPSGHLEPDAANVNVVPRRGMHLPKDGNPLSRGAASENPAEEEILVHTDFNMLQVCNAKTLEPKRLLTYANIDPELSGFGICAHPPRDRQRGTTYNYLISQEGVMFCFALDVVSNPAKLLWKTALPCKPCYIHSLAMTQDYVVFIRNVMDMLEVESESNTFFYVLRKSDGELIASYSSPNFMFFHSVNAYDFVDDFTGDTNIHVDLCSYEGNYIPYREYTLSNVVDPARPYQDGTLVRYELASVNKADLQKTERATVAQAIPGVALELPRISKYMSMNPGYRYVYATGGNAGASPGTEVPIGRLGNGLKVVQAAFFSCIVKTDWETGGWVKWQPEDGESCPCEPIFIARPGATEEDDGVVLTIVINKKGTHSILVALRGTDLKEVSRANMPQVYGVGPHGSFIEAPGMY